MVTVRILVCWVLLGFEGIKNGYLLKSVEMSTTAGPERLQRGPLQDIDRHIYVISGFIVSIDILYLNGTLLRYTLNKRRIELYSYIIGCSVAVVWVFNCSHNLHYRNSYTYCVSVVPYTLYIVSHGSMGNAHPCVAGASDRKEIRAELPAPFPFSEKPDFQNLVEFLTKVNRYSSKRGCAYEGSQC